MCLKKVPTITCALSDLTLKTLDQLTEETFVCGAYVYNTERARKCLSTQRNLAAARTSSWLPNIEWEQ